MLDETNGKAVEVPYSTTAEDTGWMTGATSVDSLDEIPTPHEEVSETSSHHHLPSAVLGQLQSRLRYHLSALPRDYHETH